MPKHIVGPWSVERVGRSPFRLLAADGQCLALLYATDPKTKQRTPEYAANMQLIEAAPELLAMLKTIRDAGKDELASGGRICFDEEALDAVIFKAEGARG